jgi:hypothetical protein
MVLVSASDREIRIDSGMDFRFFKKKYCCPPDDNFFIHVDELAEHFAVGTRIGSVIIHPLCKVAFAVHSGIISVNWRRNYLLMRRQIRKWGKKSKASRSELGLPTRSAGTGRPF